jgi:hypothetical protein
MFGGNSQTVKAEVVGKVTEQVKDKFVPVLS